MSYMSVHNSYATGARANIGTPQDSYKIGSPVPQMFQSSNSYSSSRPERQLSGLDDRAYQVAKGGNYSGAVLQARPAPIPSPSANILC